MWTCHLKKQFEWLKSTHPKSEWQSQNSLHLLQRESTKTLKRSLESWNFSLFTSLIYHWGRKKRTFCSCIPDWLFLLAYMGLVRGRLDHVFPLAETVRRTAVQRRLKQTYSESSVTGCSLSLSPTQTHSHTDIKTAVSSQTQSSGMY